MKRLSRFIILVLCLIGASACGGVDHSAPDAGPTADGGQDVDAPPTGEPCLLGTSRVGSCSL